MGVAVAIVVDVRDDKIHDLRDFENDIGEAPLGILPAFGRRLRTVTHKASGQTTPAALCPQGLLALEESQSPYIEALRGLRTALLLSRGGAPPQAVLVTSSVACEGKTTLSLNLAILLAQYGKKVLLVDADLRRPMLHTVLRKSCERGLSSLLAGNDEAGGYIASFEGVPGLAVLCSGQQPPYPSELLGSERMSALLDEWRKKFDFILFDGAPVLPVTDSVVLSDLVDTSLLLARFGATPRQSIERSYQILRSHCDARKRVSLVVNAVAQRTSSYYAYYGYSTSAYHEKAEWRTA